MQQWLVFLRPSALFLGCLFSIMNLLFYRQVVALVLGQRSSIVAALLLFLKLPLLLLLLLVLSRQETRIIGNAIAGSLIFIPASILASLRLTDSRSGEANEQRYPSKTKSQPKS